MRKSGLGNIVASNMADIIQSEAHNKLFKFASSDNNCINDNCDAEDCAHEEKDKADAKDGKADVQLPADKIEPSDKFKKEKEETDKEKAEKKDKKAQLKSLLNSVLKISEELDDFGLAKSASNMIHMADFLLAEAAGADTIEELVKENPDMDVKKVVIEEPSADLGDPDPDPDFRLEGLSFDDEPDFGSLDEQLKAIEEGGLDQPQDSLTTDQIKSFNDLINQANEEVDTWLKAHGATSGIELSADLSSLLVSAEKEVEDYLIDKNL